MDTFDDAFKEAGIATESVAETYDKLKTEADSADMNINEKRQRFEQSQKLFYGLSNSDREEAVKEFIVPRTYINASFDVEKIKNNIRAQYKKSSIYKVYKFSDYTNICEEILSTVRMKQLPKCSYLIGAPNGFGKTSFVNECLITLRAQGYKVAPYISLWELAQIRVDNEQRIMSPYTRFKEVPGEDGEYSRYSYTEARTVIAPYSKNPEIISGRYSYSEYINADCLFVSFTDVISKEIESHTLYQLLSIRALKGLPTIVMISTSLDPYENDAVLREQVWNEIRCYKETENCYDKLYHISCYRMKKTIDSGLDNKGEDIEADTGIVS